MTFLNANGFICPVFILLLLIAGPASSELFFTTLIKGTGKDIYGLQIWFLNLSGPSRVVNYSEGGLSMIYFVEIVNLKVIILLTNQYLPNSTPIIY